MVGFVDDHEIEAAAEKVRGMLARGAPGRAKRSRAAGPEPLRIAAQQRVVGGRAGNVEFGLQLLPPLPDQRRRGQHEHALDHAAQQILLEHHAGLDGLAEPDLVGQQHPAAKLLQHLAHGLDLIPEGLDAAQMRQAKQFVEALRKAEMGKAFAQARYQPPSLAGGRCQRSSSGARSSSAVNGISISINGNGGMVDARGVSAAGFGLAALLGRLLALLFAFRTGPEAKCLREAVLSHSKIRA